VIQWTIPAEFAVTSSAESVVTQSATNTQFSTSSTYYSSGSTSWGATGRTEYLSSSSSSISGTGPGQSNGTVINNTFRTTVSVQTSTTAEVALDFVSTYSFADDGEEVIFEPTTIWTTTKTGEVVEFTQSEVPMTIFAPTFGEAATYEGQNVPVTYTIDRTTVLTQTQTSALAATVIQANTLKYIGEINSFPEILYSISEPASVWSGFEDATEIAQSTTRMTIQPSFVTAATPIKNATATTTSSVANPADTWSTVWFPSRTTQEQITTTTSLFCIPAVTGTRTTSATRTTQSQTTNTIFPAETLTFGRTGGATTSSATTSIVTSYGTVSRIVDRYAGTLLFETTISNTFSASRYITTTAAATLTSSVQNANATATAVSATTFNFAGNQTVFPSAQISVRQNLLNEIGFNLGIPARTRIITTGAVLGSQTGHYFTADFTTIAQMVTLARGGLALYPVTYPWLTVDGDSITYTTSTNRTDGTGTQPTTTSGLVSVSGSSQTSTERLTLGRPAQHGAREVGAGCSLVDVMQAGAFRDRINTSVTSSFYGQATLYTAGESADIRYWSPIAAITPLELRGNKNAVTFSAERNVADIPPVSSLNAW
jgi:hypothetical protein